MIKLGTTKLLNDTTAVLQIGVEYLDFNLDSLVLVHLEISDFCQISRAEGENKNCVGIPRTIYAMQNELKMIILSSVRPPIFVKILKKQNTSGLMSLKDILDLRYLYRNANKDTNILEIFYEVTEYKFDELYFDITQIVNSTAKTDCIKQQMDILNFNILTDFILENISTLLIKYVRKYCCFGRLIQFLL